MSSREEIEIKNGGDGLIFYTNAMLPKFTESRLEINRRQVERLQQLPQPAQRSAEWYEMRNSMLSASDWGAILGISKYGGKNQVLLKKCSEQPFFTNDAMQWGVKYEAVAIQIYEKRNQTEVIEFGCIRHPTISHLGASPDGITRDGVMVEIKCPSSRVIDGVIPEGYYCQVQGQLEVCELDRCDFLECKLLEYLHESEYLADCNEAGDYHYNQFGGEKGVVANFYDKVADKKYFEYSPIGLIGEELESWKADVEARFREKGVVGQQFFNGFTYWYLERVSCIPIYRNQEWFYKASKELEEFWKKVLYYREVGVEKMKEDLQREKEAKKGVAALARKVKGRGVTKKESSEDEAEEQIQKMSIHSVFSDEPTYTDLQIGNRDVHIGNRDVHMERTDIHIERPNQKIDIHSVFTDEVIHHTSSRIQEEASKKKPKRAVAKKAEAQVRNIFNIFSDEEISELNKK